MNINSLEDLLILLRNNDPSLLGSEQRYSLANQDEVTDDVATELAELLATNTIIEELVFMGPNMSITQEQWEIILNSLIHHPTLTRLGFESMVCNGACARHLSSMFQQNQLKIKQLYLCHNKDPLLTNQYFITLFDSLRENRSLESLEIRSSLNDKESHEQIVAVGQSLQRLVQQNTTMKHLDLSFNSSINPISSELAIGLHNNTSLVSFHYSGNFVDSAEAAAFADALCGKSQLTTLDLGWNQIRDMGIRYLIETIQHKDCSLRKLSLSCNEYSYNILEAFAAALQDNTSLRHLELSCLSGIMLSDHIPLIDALRHNTTLRSLDITINDPIFWDLTSLLDAIIEMLYYNDTIKSIKYISDITDEDYSVTSIDQSKMTSIQSILFENEQRTRIAPQKTMQLNMYRWLIESWVDPHLSLQ